MSKKPLNISSVPPAAEEPPERFEPPGIADLASLTDGRAVGQFQSLYPVSAWIQIVLELLYLLSVLFLCFGCLVLLAKYFVLKEPNGPVHFLFGELPNSEPLVFWATVTLSGVCGGCASSLKWLYHAVAKKRWHRDRIIWRIIVPILSAVLSTFSGFMIISGLVPFLSKTSLAGPGAGAAFGFFVGFFSDNVLAALQKLAYRIFGTVDKRPLRAVPTSERSEANNEPDHPASSEIVER